MVMVNSLFTPIIAGILLESILAVIMSTADSQLLLAASAFIEDIYRIVMRKNAGEKELVWMGRFAVISISAIAYLITRDSNNSVMELVSYTWTGFGTFFGPVILFSLFWSKTTRKEALGGMIISGLTLSSGNNPQEGSLTSTKLSQVSSSRASQPISSAFWTRKVLQKKF